MPFGWIVIAMEQFCIGAAPVKLNAAIAAGPSGQTGAPRIQAVRADDYTILRAASRRRIRMCVVRREPRAKGADIAVFSIVPTETGPPNPGEPGFGPPVLGEPEA